LLRAFLVDRLFLAAFVADDALMRRSTPRLRRIGMAAPRLRFGAFPGRHHLLLPEGETLIATKGSSDQQKNPAATERRPGMPV
jgi:hypothetical protein